MLELTQHLRRPGTLLLAMKGEAAESERASLGEAFDTRVIELEVPFEQGARCLIAVSRR